MEEYAGSNLMRAGPSLQQKDDHNVTFHPRCVGKSRHFNGLIS